ncbi:MAG: hypothetical protein JF888_09365 [Candidatus Dormibacteraeota bacterium]|uniref:Uncharacterized protein n=1 Tax=Candidatus Dormiibacter inghamiae TaxID=3127013 RepID=A0A934NDY3_9BACT|nr:hypothetical protein [Candidatus Dormibacteraeota bacterium]MBJ7606802.1 hypothetical protein [Candidatus Dormibacteraeota bacterium]
MRVLVEHDESGEIRSVSTVVAIESSEGSAMRARRIADPGFSLSEVEADVVEHERDVEGLRKLREAYRVTGHPDQPHLTPN